MKRTPLVRKTPLKRNSPPARKAPLSQGTNTTLDKEGSKPRLRRSGIRRSQPKRDWKDARAKVEVEAVCRYRAPEDDPCEGPLEAAHVIGRGHDLFASDKTVAWVNPHRIVPLCQKHHRAYDDHEIDILAALTTREQVQAVEDAGSIETARVRTCPSLSRKP